MGLFGEHNRVTKVGSTNHQVVQLNKEQREGPKEIKDLPRVTEIVKFKALAFEQGSQMTEKLSLPRNSVFNGNIIRK